MLATTASGTIALLQEQPEILTNLRENVKAMRAQLDPRSDWVVCGSAVENPMMLLVLKEEVVRAKKLSVEDQDQIFQDVVDEVGLPCPFPFPFPLFLHSFLFSLSFIVGGSMKLTLHSASPTASSSPASALCPKPSARHRMRRAGNLHLR